MSLIGQGAQGTVRRSQNCSAHRAPEGPGSLGMVSVISVHKVSKKLSQRIKLVDNK